MPELRFDRFYRYAELTELLRAYAAEHPNLVTLSSLGTSYEGRDVWVATITNVATGPDREKPGFWVDGNIHASEVSPSTAALLLIDRLTRGYGSDLDITRCLDSRVFYVCPRVNPDGAEWALADRPKIIRSSTRPYPYDEEPIGGLLEEDVDGDGRMLWMRVPDPNGPWKLREDEPRLLARRDPTETGGTYYRLLPEGRIRNYDGVEIKVQPKKERLDLNRNFPANWRPEKEQKGSGPFPGSEPEVRNLIAFIADHPNITGAVTFHTLSGVLLRPFDHQPDDKFPAEDLWTYQAVGRKGTQLTGYPAVSVYHEFRYHPNEVISGVFDGWLYEHLGVFAWTVELWSPQRQAGIADYKFIDWYREHPPEDDLAMLRWSDEKLGGKGYIDWYPFEHPELGRIELGGWDQLNAFRNPPFQFLENELRPFPDWLVWQALISPRLELFEASAAKVGDGAWHVRLAAHNTGWLPTYVTKKAGERGTSRGVVAEIELPEGAELAGGRPRQELGELEGRAYKPVAPVRHQGDPTDDRCKVEWVVRGRPGDRVKLTARHDRAGTVRTELTLE